MPSTSLQNPFAALSPKAVGLVAAVVTVVIWTSFIVIARASADPARGGSLSPFDIVYARLWGAGLVLLPWGWWIVRRDRRAAEVTVFLHIRDTWVGTGVRDQRPKSTDDFQESGAM